MFDRARTPKTLRFHLIVMAAALTLPFFVIACIATLRYAESERAVLTSTARENRDDLLARLDSDVAAKLTFLQTLASSPALDRNGDLARFEEQARSFELADASVLLIAPDTGTQIVNTRLPSGAPMYAKGVLTDAARRALREKQAIVSDLFRGANSGDAVIEIVMPVVRDGGVRWLLSIVMRPASIARIIIGQGIAAPYNAGIADGTGSIIARSSENERFVGRRMAGFDDGLSEGREWEGRNLQGVPILGFSKRSHLTGWHVAMGVELAALQEPLTRSLIKLALMALGMLLATALILLIMTRRLTQSWRAVILATGALARGEAVETPRTALTEADIVGRSLAMASGDLRRQALALSASNQELEHRVADRTTALQAARDRAEAGARAKAEFLANMSHELRTPLTAIVGASDLLLSGYADGSAERRTRYLEMQREAGNNLLALINDILDFSKIEAGQVEIESIAFSMRQIASSALTLVRDQASRKQVALDLVVDDAVPDLVLGDPTRVSQILINLLSNAVKFTSKGTVALHCRRTSVGEGICILVQDSGIGIPAEKLANLFDRFTQADASTTRRFGGSGLGLSITKRLVDLMGGEISVESVVGRGSLFTVALPLISVVSAPVPANSDDQPARAGKRILFAEDNEVNREIVAAMLRGEGHEVVEARNGREAVRAVQTTSDAFDIILMDIQMPEVDGYEATRFLRQKGCQLPIIALTANALSDEPARCLAAGMDMHIAKPVDWARLLDAIDTLGKNLSAAA